MRIASWIWGGQPQVGTISDCGGEVTPLAVADARAGALELIEALVAGRALPRASAARLPVQAIELCAPLPRPGRGLFCVGRNYRAHAAELAGSVFSGQAAHADGWPMVFTKFAQCVIGPHDTVRLPGAAVSNQIDYEGELVIVIGRGGRDIPRARALDHVFGYTLCNDVTARDIQVRHGQWDLGKNLDTFCPLGPWIASADSFDASDARLRTWVNGELRQDARTADLIFDIPSLVETCSRGITLQTGDLIATGTPAGVGMGMAPPRWLASGDVVRVEVDGLGAIENRFE